LTPLETKPIGPLARRDDAPVFDEPWQAQVLALAYGLAEEGLFSSATWSETLGEELRLAAARGEPDDHETYYAAALTALERLIAADGRVTTNGLAARIEEWRHAYLRTPHGQPVELSTDGNL
jgi:nitrile hydratase accessory protein